MSNYLAVAAVTMALRDLVQAAVNATNVNATVTIQRPALAAGGGAAASRVNLYLFQVTPNPHLGNNDLPTRRADGTRSARSQVALNLHYLLSFYGEETDCEPERLLGGVVSALHAQPQLDRAAIRTRVADTSFLRKSDLADQVELVKFSPLGFNLEELSKLWSVFFQTPYTLSVAYTASVVLIADNALPEVAKPVATPTIQFGRIDAPTDAQPGVQPGAQPGAQPGRAPGLQSPADSVTREKSDTVPVPVRVPAAQPDALAKLELWLRADAGIAHDRHGFVAAWGDQSGQGNDAKQDRQAARPQFVRNILRGKPALRFDGKDDYLAIERLTYAAAAVIDGLTLFALLRTSALQRQFLVSYDAEAYWSVALSDEGRLSWQTRAPNPGARRNLLTDQPCADGGWHLVCVRFAAGADPDKQIFVDGSEVKASNAHNGALLGTGDPRFGFIGVGSRAAAADGEIGPLNFLHGDLAELAIYARALAPSERRQIEQYFVDKYLRA